MTTPLLRPSLFALALLFAAGCGGSENLIPLVPDTSVPAPDAGDHPDGSVCEAPCGSDCCAPGFTCKQQKCEPYFCETETEFCTRLGIACGPAEGSDRCGAPRKVDNCNTCGEGEECGTDGRCVCKAETDEAFCRRLDKTCGSVNRKDNCDNDRTVNCGQCAAPEICDLETNRCIGCSETDEAFCSRLRFECGPAEGIDICGKARSVTNCGACHDGELCNIYSTCELCIGETPTELCGAANRECGAFNAVDRCGASQPIASCGECTGAASTCQPDGRCVNLAGNDTCATARELPFDASGHAHTRGSNVGATNDSTSSLCTGSGADVVYTVEVTQTSTLAVTLVPDTLTTATGWSVYLRSDCQFDASELRCSNNVVDKTQPVSMTARNLLPGTYYLWVDGYSGVSGAFTLQATLTESTSIPTNDLCSAAAVLPFVDGVASVHGDTGLATHRDTGSCGKMNGGDLFYQFTLSDPASVVATVTRAQSTPGWKPTLYLRHDCTAAGEVRCGKEIAAHPGEATVFVPSLAAGTYYLVVDGLQGTWGEFQLDVTLGEARTPPPHDQCANALELPLRNGSVSISDDTTAAFDQYTGTCGAMNGTDLVYSFTLTDPATILARLTRDPTTPSFEAAMYIRKSDCESVDSADELACVKVANSTGRAAITKVYPAGTYYVIVDATSASFGKFTLDLIELPPTVNENCQSLRTLAFDANGAARATGSTEIATHDTEGTCGGSNLLNTPGVGNDVVYEFTLTAPKQVDVTVTPDSDIQAVVYVRSKCDNKLSTNELGCKMGASGAPATVSIPKLLPGTYYVWVDSGYKASAFTLDLVTRDIPAPAGDTCPGVPLDLSSGTVSVKANNLLAADDYSGTCFNVSNVGVMNGGDLVYRINLPTAKSLTAKVTRDITLNKDFHPTLYVRKGSCTATDAASEVLCGGGNIAPLANNTFSLYHPNLPAGDYWVIVDGSAGSDGSYTQWNWGGFTLELTTGPAIMNDTCAYAEPINLSRGQATVTGDTTNATDDSSQQGCGGAIAGTGSKDLVWYFDLAAPQVVTATATASVGSALKPAVYIRQLCSGTNASDSYSTVGCGRDATSSGTASATSQLLVPGRYFVWIDGNSAKADSATAGAFTLTLDASDPAQFPPNDRCGRAQFLQFNATGTATLTGATTVGALDDYQSTCSAGTAYPYSRGGDLAYSFELTERSTVNITVKPPTGSTLIPSVYVRSDCDKQEDLACAASNAVGKVATTSVFDLAPGFYYVIVDAANSSSGLNNGTFDLTVSAGPAPADGRCDSHPVPIDLTSGSATVQGDLTFATPKYSSSSCTKSNGRDLVYTFTLAADKIMTISASATGWSPTTYVRTNCSAASSEVICSATGTLAANRLKAGTYYLFVDGDRYSSNSNWDTAGSLGPFTLTITTSDPVIPANDECRAAETLTLDQNGYAKKSGNTTYAWNDTAGGCESSSNPMTGPDMVYELTLASERSVTLKVTRTGTSTLSPAVYMRPACERTTGEVLCTPKPNSPPSSITVQKAAVPAGTYYVIVDGFSGTYGAFDLEVTTGPSVPNDTCENPTELTFIGDTATVTGTTVNASNYTTGTCDTSASPDAVYFFTLGRDAKVTINATAASGSTISPTLYVRENCDAKLSQIAGACAKGTSSTTTLVVPILAPGTYYLWVDSAGTNISGAFTLTVTTSAPPNLPDGDTCASAIPLTFDINGKATKTGDTTGTTHRTSGLNLCNLTTAGELFYQFNLAQPQSVKVKVIPTTPSTFAPVAYLRRDCNATSIFGQVACLQAPSGQTSAEGTVYGLDSGTWYVIVDSTYSKPVGAFTLEVTQLPANAGPANSSCFNPQTLVFNGPKTSVQGTVVGANNDTKVSGGNGVFGADVVYTFTTAQKQNITATVVPNPAFATYKPIVIIRNNCDDQTSQLAYTTAAAARDTVTATAKNAAPGTYYVWVDSQAGEGDFELTVSLATDHDTCAAPVVLAHNVPVTGSTVPAVNDYGAGPFPSECSALGSSQPGRDLVYRYTPAVSGPFTVTVTPSGNFDPSIWVTTGACGDAVTCIGAADSARAGGVETLTIAGVAGTEYYIIVDSAVSTEAGNFTISVQ